MRRRCNFLPQTSIISGLTHHYRLALIWKQVERESTRMLFNLLKVTRMDVILQSYEKRDDREIHFRAHPHMNWVVQKWRICCIIVDPNYILETKYRGNTCGWLHRRYGKCRSLLKKSELPVTWNIWTTAYRALESYQPHDYFSNSASRTQFSNPLIQ